MIFARLQPTQFTIRILRLCCLCLSVVATSSFGGDDSSSIDPDLGPPPGRCKITAENGVISFPFELYRGDIRFEAKVNGHPVRLLLDNGHLWDDMLFFGSPRVDSLGLKIDGEAELSGGGSGDAVQSTTASNVTVSFNGVEFYDQNAVITPHNLGRMWAGSEGQISAAFFKNFVVDINLDKGMLTLTEPDKFVYRGDGVELPMTPLGMGAWGIPMTLELEDGRLVELISMMDLGLGHQFDISQTGPNRLIAPEKSVAASLGFGVQGETLGRIGRLTAVKIGEYRMPDVIAGFIDPDHSGQVFTETMVGLGLLSRFNFVYDYPGHRMFIEPNSTFADRYEYNMSGFDMRRRRGEPMHILRIHPNSPAAEAGLKIDDFVITLNGRPAESYTVFELIPLMKQEGARIDLTIKRDGETFDLSLTLRPII